MKSGSFSKDWLLRSAAVLITATALLASVQCTWGAGRGNSQQQQQQETGEPRHSFQQFLKAHLDESPVRPVLPSSNPIHDAIPADKVILMPFLTAGSLRIAEAATLPAVPKVNSGSARSLGANGVWIEFEHAPLTLREVEDLIIFAHANGLVPAVRVKANDVNTFKPILDSGAMMIVVPQIHDAAEARQAVRSCLYPPSGNRPAGVGRASGYFTYFSDYRQKANSLMSVALMVETKQAIENIESICAELRPGKDLLWIGPYDLSEDMQAPIGSPEHSKAIAKVEAAARKYGIGIGGNAATPEQLMQLFDRGYRVFTFNLPPETGIAKQNADFFSGR